MICKWIRKCLLLILIALLKILSMGIRTRIKNIETRIEWVMRSMEPNDTLAFNVFFSLILFSPYQHSIGHICERKQNHCCNKKMYCYRISRWQKKKKKTSTLGIERVKRNGENKDIGHPYYQHSYYFLLITYRPCRWGNVVSFL